MRLEDALRKSARLLPDKVALVAKERRTTFGELDAQTNQFAHALNRAGHHRGDRTVIFLDSCIEAAVAMFGANKAGGIYSLVNAMTKPAKLAFIAQDLGPRFVVTQKRLLPVVQEIMKLGSTIERVFVIDPPAAGFDGDGKVVAFADALAAESTAGLPVGGIDIDLAYVMYTSGSTGFPKGVMMTHQSSHSGASSIIEYIENTPDDIILSVIPLSFDYGMYQVIMTMIFGGTLVLETSFAFPNAVVQKMIKEKVTGFPLVPTTASLLLQIKSLVPGAIPTLRYLTNTAAPLPPAHIERLLELFPGVKIFSNYGLTENVRGTYLPPDQIRIRPTSVGKAMPNSEAQIVDDHGKPVPPGAVGELVFRAAHILRGYWNNEVATHAALKHGKYPWEKTLHTGDLFRADEEGYLYFLGRKDDIFKSRGEKVSPKEIENVLYELEGIREAAVIGVPDPVQGLSIRAVVAFREGVVLTEKDIKAHCAKRLEEFMIPSSIEVRDELPKTESGKIKRRELQDEAAAKAATA
jgi:long-chain acyl-CoA synthetase